jgi:hypothetical protein
VRGAPRIRAFYFPDRRKALADSVFTLEQKLNYIATQIGCCEEGLISAVVCPYCDAINAKGQRLCCDMFSKSARAVIALQSAGPLAA